MTARNLQLHEGFACRFSNVLPSKSLPILTASAVAASYVILLCLLFEPRWETNDDVSMSMVAHGYGGVAFSSPQLVFSNVLWGYLVRAIPEINGVLGYSLATLATLIVFGAVLLFGLYRLGLGVVPCLSALVLTLTRPVLFPQFTVNAGLLVVAAVICWHLYARDDDWRALFVACLFAFSGYLVRSQEFYLVLLVALPLLPWRVFLIRQPARAALIAFALATITVEVIEDRVRQRPEWRDFTELASASLPFTDFGADSHLKQRPDILDRYGYTANDIDLVSSRFFVDPKIANPSALRAMLDELGPLPLQAGAHQKAWLGVRALWHPDLRALFLSAFFLALFKPRRQVAVSWGITLVAVLGLGLLGRPGVLRVYVPVVSLLVIAPFFGGRLASKLKWPVTVVLLSAAVLSTPRSVAQARESEAVFEYVQDALVGFPEDMVVVWGGSFPFEAAYPVLGTSPSAMTYQFYGLGGFTLAPFSVPYAELQEGRSMASFLTRETGVPIIASEREFAYLRRYCWEHLRGDLRELSAEEYGPIVVSRRRCER